MLKLSAISRPQRKNKTGALRKAGSIPAVLYGPSLSSVALSVAEKEFEKIYLQAGSSSLISLDAGQQSLPVLIHDVQLDPVSDKIIHIDFYQPPLDKKIEIVVPLVFEGEAPAVKNFGGTLVKNIQEVEVRAFPGELPHEIRVSVGRLATLEDEILVKDLEKTEGIEILRNGEDIIAKVLPPEKVEEELAKPVEEKTEDVGKVERPKKEEESESPLAE